MQCMLFSAIFAMLAVLATRWPRGTNLRGVNGDIVTIYALVPTLRGVNGDIVTIYAY